ncbi:hypothetical protein TNCV_1830981 [Trichonephila clavipes]|nr:hypothetical protein TNCV_1830981 [Trichonephila clavipes]
MIGSDTALDDSAHVVGLKADVLKVTVDTTMKRLDVMDDVLHLLESKPHYFSSVNTTENHMPLGIESKTFVGWGKLANFFKRKNVAVYSSHNYRQRIPFRSLPPGFSLS